MTDLYLIRHAQAVEEKAQVPAPEAPLAPPGIIQAERLRPLASLAALPYT